MRIAYVCSDPGVPVFGRKGSSIHVQEVIRALLRSGAEVEIFATRLDGEVPADLQEVRRHWLPALPKGELAAREQASLGANRSLHAALMRQGRFDLVYERYSLWSFAAMEYARATGARGLLEVNAPLIEEQARHRGLVDRASAEQVAARVFAAASNVLAVSREVARYVERYPGMQDRVHVVPNGVSYERFAGIDPTNRANSPFTVGFVGTLKPWHGLSTLVDSFAMLHEKHRDAHLVIVGDGPERMPLLARLAAAELQEAVHFWGEVPPEQVAAILGGVTVAVAPYPALDDFYFSPLKVYEYMAAGCAVVASRIGQVAELIEHERTGLLCEAGDAAALASALERLHEDRALGTYLGAQARELVLRDHSWDAVVQRILEISGAADPDTQFATASGA